jgi:hypothetical protein
MMSDFFDSLPKQEKQLLDAGAELIEARRLAEAAMRSGDANRMRRALERLASARTAVKEILP